MYDSMQYDPIQSPLKLKIWPFSKTIFLIFGVVFVSRDFQVGTVHLFIF